MSMRSFDAGRGAARLVALAVIAASGCYITVDPEPPPPSWSGAGGSEWSSGAGGSGYPGGGAAGGGGSNGPFPPDPGRPADCPNLGVSRFKELLLVDASVTRDSRADNAAAHRPWSFRGRLEDLGLYPEAASPLADAWLAQWGTLVDVPVSTTSGTMGSRVPVVPRPDADRLLRCPWLRLSPENGCDQTCTTCRTYRPDLARAPFRLLAIVNRVDLAGDQACAADGGELRFVYGALDPNTMDPIPLTVIFEYRVTLRAGETVRAWATGWHELGALPFGPELNAQLDVVVAYGLARASLVRVLTNENVFGAPADLPWEMRQFVAAQNDAGVVRLVEVAVSDTPRLTLSSTPELGRWIDENASTILRGQNPLPPEYIAASAPIPTPDFTWRTTARNPDVGAAFNRNTCNGCHGGRVRGDLLFHHIGPPASGYGPSGGAAQLSRFLHDPGNTDELGRRERVMAELICTGCCVGCIGGSY